MGQEEVVAANASSPETRPLAARSWASLNSHQLGRFAEYHVTMSLVRAGLDVYAPAIDDRGIDLITRLGHGRYLEIQVKATRGFNYLFLRKSVFSIDPFRYLAYVLFTGETEPTVYLIPSTAWLVPDNLFVSRDYEGKKSDPEYGLTVTKSNLGELNRHRLELTLAALVQGVSEGTHPAQR